MKLMLQGRDGHEQQVPFGGYDGSFASWRKNCVAQNYPHPSSCELFMAGIQPGAARPVELKLHQKSRVLEISFDDGKTFQLTCEFLRVYSPSAEVRGHGPGQEVLQAGKADVQITAIEPVGHYAVKLVFSDGHDTGLYSWDYLYSLGENQPSMWQRYQERLALAGLQREPAGTAPPATAAKPGWKKL